jgi:hypothetical protein
MHKLVLVAAACAATLIPTAANAATATEGPTGVCATCGPAASVVRIVMTGSDAATLTYSPGVTLRPVYFYSQRVGGRIVKHQVGPIGVSITGCYRTADIRYMGDIAINPDGTMNFKAIASSSCPGGITTVSVATVGVGTVLFESLGASETFGLTQ